MVEVTEGKKRASLLRTLVNKWLKKFESKGCREKSFLRVLIFFSSSAHKDATTFRRATFRIAAFRIATFRIATFRITTQSVTESALQVKCDA
jgi:hypothetical protein